MENFGLTQDTITKILDYFKSKPEIELVKIFGSRAKGNYRLGSDIDFAIWLDENKSNYQMDLYNLSTPYKFDVIDYKNLNNLAMKNSIDSEAKDFYKRSK